MRSLQAALPASVPVRPWLPLWHGVPVQEAADVRPVRPVWPVQAAVPAADVGLWHAASAVPAVPVRVVRKPYSLVWMVVTLSEITLWMSGIFQYRPGPFTSVTRPKVSTRASSP